MAKTEAEELLERMRRALKQGRERRLVDRIVSEAELDHESALRKIDPNIAILPSEYAAARNLPSYGDSEPYRKRPAVRAAKKARQKGAPGLEL